MFKTNLSYLVIVLLLRRSIAMLFRRFDSFCSGLDSNSEPRGSREVLICFSESGSQKKKCKGFFVHSIKFNFVSERKNCI